MKIKNERLEISRIERDGRPAVRLACGNAEHVLDGTQLETLIGQLALYRSALKPPVPARVSPTHGYRVCFDPMRFSEPNLTINGVVLLLRDAGFGWLGFAFNRTHMEHLYAEMSVLADRMNQRALVSRDALVH